MHLPKLLPSSSQFIAISVHILGTPIHVDRPPQTKSPMLFLPELALFLGFIRWAWKRCTHAGSEDSATWPAATAADFHPIPRVCRLVLAVYQIDLHIPKIIPYTAVVINPEWIVKRVSYKQTLGHTPPYLIYCDHDNREIVLAIRGLNLAKESDYKLLLDNRLGKQMYDGGYVHHGLLKSAIWLLNRESETLKRLWEENGRVYKMIFAGHSLGSGVAALLTVVVVNHRHQLGGIPRSLIQCYSLAPARCMSLNMAVKYADVIHSVILQDDFLPRTATPLEDIFESIFCLPCVICVSCLKDTFISEERKLRDPRRLYAPGRLYHIVERKSYRCRRYPPEVRTAIPVDGRFEHIVLSCNATSDHAIIWIQKEAEKALQIMEDNSSDTAMSPPSVKRMERVQTMENEHKVALKRAVSLNVPHAENTGEEPPCNAEDELSSVQTEEPSRGNSKSKPNWDVLVEKLFKKP